jgi:hypothetical protein
VEPGQTPPSRAAAAIPDSPDGNVMPRSTQSASASISIDLQEETASDFSCLDL